MNEDIRYGLCFKNVRLLKHHFDEIQNRTKRKIQKENLFF